MRLYGYVGPDDIRRAIEGQPRGTPIASRGDLIAWFETQDEDSATYVVDRHGTLLVAPRRSEHVACAGGEEVLAAGELSAIDGDVVEISNQSTGYCPEVACWSAVQSALDRAGIRHPGAFTFAVELRRCERCRERNLIKDDDYTCAICGAALPKSWNFGA